MIPANARKTHLLKKVYVQDSLPGDLIIEHVLN
jgi:hypothetical protein